MNKFLAKFLIRWVTAITNAILYQSNIFPQEHLVEISGSTVDLIEYLESLT